MVGDHARQEAARAVVPTELVLGRSHAACAFATGVCVRGSTHALRRRRVDVAQVARAAPSARRSVDDGRVRRAGAVEQL